MLISKGLLAVAKALQLFGIFCLVYFVGDAVLAMARDTRVSDAIADVVPFTLFGVLGCALAWSIALAIEGCAKKTARP